MQIGNFSIQQNRLLLSLIFFLALSPYVHSQGIIQGRVLDISKKNPIEGVAVFNTSGKVSLTDSLGNYEIPADINDSLYFSYLGKKTKKFPVRYIEDLENFDISVQLDIRELPTVMLRPRNYKQDSIQNRQDYAKVFNYRAPTLSVISDHGYSPSSGVGVGFDLDGIINMFNKKNTRDMEAFQERLIEEEQNKYIDSRFSKRTVSAITKLTAPALDTFMQLYRPSFELLQKCNDIELDYYINEAFKLYNSLQRGVPWTPNNVILNLNK
ncbi:MAG: hypothetical protein QM528_08915 [Phycisphaerales bacterium]|nr:hypothetical protein [Phycisphaerales bacterium]